MQTIYVESDIQDHPRVKRIIQQFNQKTVITCHHYGEVFNRKNQNFRVQKQAPSLILANKKGKKVLPTPEGFGIGGQKNYYFSHLLNCPFDCRYCFLQGMYKSAHYVLFINYEDFQQDIAQFSESHPQPSYFFSGYDGDSLAYEPVSGFLNEFLPFFSQQKKAILELRTKSANVKSLLKHPATPNCIVAFSLTPQEISQHVEHKVPSIEKRLRAMQTLANHGYRIGLRFDPMIFCENFAAYYTNLIQKIFKHIRGEHVHSISLGPMRFPEKMFHAIKKLYPYDPLLNQSLVKRNNTISYHKTLEDEMSSLIESQCAAHVDSALIFRCHT